jgi:hypothetical protein
MKAARRKGLALTDEMAEGTLRVRRDGENEGDEGTSARATERGAGGRGGLKVTQRRKDTLVTMASTVL